MFDGRVTNTVYQGETFLLQVELTTGRSVSVRGITTSASSLTVPATGGAIRLGLDVADTVLLEDAKG